MKLFDNLQDEISKALKNLFIFTELLKEFRSNEKELTRLLHNLSERVRALEVEVQNIKANQPQVVLTKQALLNVLEKYLSEEDLGKIRDRGGPQEIAMPDPPKLSPPDSTGERPRGLESDKSA